MKQQFFFVLFVFCTFSIARAIDAHADPITDQLFHSMQLDSDTDLYYSNARWYDPKTRAFLSPDPILGNNRLTNEYTYGDLNPMDSWDPSGMQAKLDFWLFEVELTPRDITRIAGAVNTATKAIESTVEVAGSAALALADQLPGVNVDPYDEHKSNVANAAAGIASGTANDLWWLYETQIGIEFKYPFYAKGKGEYMNQLMNGEVAGPVPQIHFTPTSEGLVHSTTEGYSPFAS
ncbi:MAG: hypothetical protein KDD70_14325, partial [Bdellovibrionales bacterium]|nr:hypothetical protein [Bdellovibrionales bacterium]